MKIFFGFIITVLFSLFIISCNKDAKPVTPQPTKTDHIIASPWKLDTAGFDQDRNGAIDISVMGFISGCVRDNALSFQTNNTGTTDEGATKCNGADPQTTTFNWSFADAEANLSISNSVLTPLNGKSKILELNSTVLKLTKDTIISGVTLPIIVQLKH